MVTTQTAVDDRQLFPLLTSAPAEIEAMTGRRLSDRAILRWVLNGVEGVHLRCVTVGRTRCTNRHWLLNFFEKVEEARRAKRATTMTRRRRTRR